MLSVNEDRTRHFGSGAASVFACLSFIRELGNIKAVLFTRSRFYFYHSFYRQPDGALCGSGFNRFFTRHYFFFAAWNVD